MGTLTAKRAGFGLEAKTFTGESGTTYIGFHSADGSFHVVAEVEAKKAARDCGAVAGHNTRSEWKSIWLQESKTPQTEDDGPLG